MVVVLAVDLVVAMMAVVQRNQARPLAGSVTTALKVMAQVFLALAVEGAAVVQTVPDYLVPPNPMAAMVAAEGPMTYLVHLWLMAVEAVADANQAQFKARQLLVAGKVVNLVWTALMPVQIQVEAVEAVEFPHLVERAAMAARALLSYVI
jgi:hypothetical protein